MKRLPKILIVDDNRASRATLSGLLAEDPYELHFAENGPEAMIKASGLMPDLILLDQMMPGMSGMEVCEAIRAQKQLAEIPVVFVTALDDRQTRLAAFNAGADDVLTKPVDRLEMRMRVRNITRLNRYRNLVESRQDVHRALTRLEQAYGQTIAGWSRALELRDMETKGHSDRVTTWTMDLASALGISGAEREILRRGALLHDIGKMGIPDAILLKQGRLTPAEWDWMRQHPVYGRDMLANIHYLEPSIDVPYCHHERWDGNGYPEGLAGEKIPYHARIFSVVDVFDALTSDRPYRKAWTFDATCEYIASQSGTQFDPEVTKVFLSLARGGKLSPVEHLRSY